MSHRFLKRLSPGTVIASIALFVSLGGVSYGVATGSIDSREIKNNSVTGTDIKGSSVKGSDVGANTLTGSDIAESSLGNVPSATSAGRANTAGFASNAGTAANAGTAGNANTVGGVTIRSFKREMANTTAAAEVLNIGGLVLNAACSGGSVLSLTADTTVDNAAINSYSVEADADAQAPQNTQSDNDFDAADPLFNLVPDDEDQEVGSTRYARPGGGGVVVSWHAYDPAGAAFTCAVSGTAQSF